MMPEALSYSAAFLLGLAGSPHCLGMCGGITGLLSASVAAPTRQQGNIIASEQKLSNGLHSVYYSVLFQLGRISSYALLGAILGGSIAAARSFADTQLLPISQGLRILASVMLILMALSIAGWRGLALTLEKVVGGLWQKLQPLSKHLIPINTPAKALAIGGLWGLLPCGLIYSTLIWSALSSSAAQSAILMACFGLGTAPAVLSIGSLSGGLRGAIKKTTTRYGFATLLILLALYPLYTLYAHQGSHHHSTEHQDHTEYTDHMM
ncbi:sulfite exporter TauE/SafE family protein [Zhongshania marina]|uniref:Urease accessory protein UreH-like transmembrane domain-containing protein n=1 Tax=Zhongshania marina TaxID=2304603 RepID=A0A2S4HBJ5_9GAMM|nr:sulfite exporter TauE/SafE family protein [Marortus luteolus]POP51355.1 hypothetical protein C0068_17080 [Marortus luteolus]